MGNSITFGIGSTDGAGYRKVLFEKLLAEGYQVKMVGSQQNGSFSQPYCEGYPGKVISYLADSIVAKSASYKPDFILLEIGTNDVSYPVDPEHAVLRLGSLIDKLVATFPAANVVIATITPIWTKRATEFNKDLPGLVNIKKAQGMKVHLCDMYNQGIGINEVPDAVHPNDAGYIKMANAWFDAVTAILRMDKLPNVPENLLVQAGPGQAVLKWSAAFQASGYKIKRSLSANGPFKEIGKTTKNFWFVDTSIVNGKTYYYEVTGYNDAGEGPLSKVQSVSPEETLPLAINCGGPKTAGFFEDFGFEDGQVANWFWDKIDLRQVVNKNAVFVFKTGREGNFVYKIEKLNPNKFYTLKLHFAEGEFSQPGKRTFDVNINGVRKLANFDIFEKAQGKNVGHTESFYLKPNASGQIEIRFVSVIGNAHVSGIEIGL